MNLCMNIFNYLDKAYKIFQDHSKDTPLIHAVKGGHKNIVEALIKKHVDVDLPGKEKKTPVYTAVEKGHNAILKLLLASNPDLELCTTVIYKLTRYFILSTVCISNIINRQTCDNSYKCNATRCLKHVVRRCWHNHKNISTNEKSIYY